MNLEMKQSKETIGKWQEKERGREGREAKYAGVHDLLAWR